MSKSSEKKDGARPGRGKLKLLVGALVLLGVGAGGAMGAVQAGLIGHAKEASEPDVPRLVMKGAEDPFAPAAGKGEGEQARAVYGEGGSKFRTAYYSFEESFTSNLKNSPAMIQLNLAASTRRDGRVLQWLKLHEIAMRSAILVELAATPEEDVYTVAGKQRLQQRLTAAINTVLVANEGFGGVDAVHFEAFVVQ